MHCNENLYIKDIYQENIWTGNVPVASEGNLQAI